MRWLKEAADNAEAISRQPVAPQNHTTRMREIERIVKPMVGRRVVLFAMAMPLCQRISKRRPIPAVLGLCLLALRGARPRRWRSISAITTLSASCFRVCASVWN